MSFVTSAILGGVIWTGIKTLGITTVDYLKKALGNWSLDDKDYQAIAATINEAPDYAKKTEKYLEAFIDENEVIKGILQKIEPLSEDLDVPALKLLTTKSHLEVHNLEIPQFSLSHYTHNPFSIGGFKLAQKNLTLLPPKPVKLFGREKDLKELEEFIGTFNNDILITGLLGIGKTELCKHYLWDNYNKYSYVGWINYTSSLKESFIEQFNLSGYILGIFNIKDTPSEKFEKIIQFLNSLDSSTLLIIDDVKNEDKDLGILHTFPFKVMVNSRMNLDNFEKYYLDTLSTEACKELFYHHYNTQKDDENLEKLIHFAANHTLSIIRLAKTCREQALSIKDMAEKIQDSDSNLANFTGDTALPSNGSKDSAKGLLEQITDEFSLSNLNKDEKYILMNLSVLPASYIDINHIITWLEIKSKDSINSLIKKGWLQQSGFRVCMHPIIGKAVKHTTKPTIKKCEKLLKSLASNLNYESSNTPLDKKEYVALAESVLKNFKQNNALIASICNRLSLVYHASGQLEKALNLQLRALDIGKLILDDKHPNFAVYYNNLGVIYKDLGQLDKSLEVHMQAKNICEATSAYDHKFLAACYDNLSLIYNRLRQQDNALEFQLKALELREKFIGANHPDLAKSYNNLSTIYTDSGQLDKALIYQQKAVDALVKLYGEYHPSTATAYNNLSNIFKKMDFIDKAIESQLKAIEIGEKVFEGTHPHLAIAYNNLGSIYVSKKDTVSALKSYCKSGKIYENINNREKALKSYNKMINLDDNSIEAWRSLERIYRDSEDYDKANEASKRIEEIIEEKDFKSNLKSKININRITIDRLHFLEKINWNIQPQVNILLGRNGYGKTYLFRLILVLLQKNKNRAAEFFDSGKEDAYAKIFITRNTEHRIIHRTKTVFEESIGRIPVLAIPNSRLLDKSNGVVTPAPSTLKETNLTRFGAYNFIKERNEDGRIQQFLYSLCTTYLDNGKCFDAEIFNLLQDVIHELTGDIFEFKEIKKTSTNAEFQVYVATENSDTPILFQRVSMGTLSVLIIFGLIYNFLKAAHPRSKNVVNEDGIVFIDEVDSHLHPEWQRKIVPLLRRSFPNVQFFLTAHSPLVVGGCLDGEVAVLRKTEKSCFSLHQFKHDFIGWDISDLYNLVFGVEQKDESFFYYSTLSLFKDEIEKEIIEIEENGTKSKDDESRLKKLYNDMYYLSKLEKKNAQLEASSRIEQASVLPELQPDCPGELPDLDPCAIPAEEEDIL
ncbi:MAG: tetratricopeptide repeat protein [Clostridia bacterium]|nr:tetratricopeptide repeat protein [Clostridia bacterium]